MGGFNLDTWIWIWSSKFFRTLVGWCTSVGSHGPKIALGRGGFGVVGIDRQSWAMHLWLFELKRFFFKHSYSCFSTTTVTTNKTKLSLLAATTIKTPIIISTPYFLVRIPQWPSQDGSTPHHDDDYTHRPHNNKTISSQTHLDHNYITYSKGRRGREAFSIHPFVPSSIYPSVPSFIHGWHHTWQKQITPPPCVAV